MQLLPILTRFYNKATGKTNNCKFNNKKYQLNAKKVKPARSRLMRNNLTNTNTRKENDVTFKIIIVIASIKIK